MKKKKILLLIVGTFISTIGLNSFSAKCNNEEINAFANDVYYTINGLFADESVEYDRVEILIENVPEDIYIIAINNTLNKKTVIKEFENGLYALETPSIYEIYNYTLKIYSSSTECENELLRTENFDTIAYNPYSKGSYCTELGEKAENFDGCYSFSSKKYDDETFTKALEKHLNQQPENVENKIIELFYQYYYFALIPIAVLGVYYILRLTIIKRSKKKDEEN